MLAPLVLVLALGAGASGAPARSDADAWTGVRQLGGAGRDFALDVACDPAGGVVVGGGSEDLGPDGEHRRSAFVTAFDRAGSVRWSHALPDLDGAYAVATDSAGNAVVATLDLARVAAAPDFAVSSFITKYGPAGEQRWHLRLAVAPRVVVADLAADAAGNVYVAGELTPEGRTVGLSSADAFVTKLDSAGRVVWTRTLATDAHDTAAAVAVDGDGRVHVAGLTEGDLAAKGAGGSDAFVARLGAGGEVEWKVQLGSEVDDEATSVAPGRDGGSILLRSRALPNGTVWSVVALGRGRAPVWERTIAEAAAQARGLAVAPSGEIVVAVAQPARSGIEAETIALDGRGQRRWSSMTHEQGDQIPAAVAVDGARGGVFVVGTTEGAFHGLGLQGVADAFVLKLGRDGRAR